MQDSSKVTSSNKPEDTELNHQLHDDKNALLADASLQGNEVLHDKNAIPKQTQQLQTTTLATDSKETIISNADTANKEVQESAVLSENSGDEEAPFTHKTDAFAHATLKHNLDNANTTQTLQEEVKNNDAGGHKNFSNNINETSDSKEASNEDVYDYRHTRVKDILDFDMQMKGSTLVKEEPKDMTSSRDNSFSADSKGGQEEPHNTKDTDIIKDNKQHVETSEVTNNKTESLHNDVFEDIDPNLIETPKESELHENVKQDSIKWQSNQKVRESKKKTKKPKKLKKRKHNWNYVLYSKRLFLSIAILACFIGLYTGYLLFGSTSFEVLWNLKETKDNLARQVEANRLENAELQRSVLELKALEPH